MRIPAFLLCALCLLSASAAVSIVCIGTGVYRSCFTENGIPVYCSGFPLKEGELAILLASITDSDDMVVKERLVAYDSLRGHAACTEAGNLSYHLFHDAITCALRPGVDIEHPGYSSAGGSFGLSCSPRSFFRRR